MDILHSSANGHFRCHHILTSVNDASNEHSCNKVLCRHTVVKLLNIYVGVELQGHTLTLMFNILRKYQIVFQSGSTILHSHWQYIRFNFSTSLPPLIIICPSTICWTLLFPPSNGLDITEENQLTVNVRVYFWILNSIPLIHIYICLLLLLVTLCPDYYSLIVSFEIGKCESSTLFWFFKTVLVILDPLHFYMSFNIHLSSSANKASWDFDW